MQRTSTTNALITVLARFDVRVLTMETRQSGIADFAPPPLAVVNALDWPPRGVTSRPVGEHSQDRKYITYGFFVEEDVFAVCRVHVDRRDIAQLLASVREPLSKAVHIAVFAAVVNW